MSEISGRNQVHRQAIVSFPMVNLFRHYQGSNIDDLNNSLATLIRMMESTKSDEYLLNKTYTQGGYHTKPDFLDRNEPPITRFKNEILIPGVVDYLTVYYKYKQIQQRPVTPERIQIRGWGNIMRKGEWNAPHNHPAINNRISAVYYIKVPKCPRPQGALQFDNPNQIAVQHGDYGNVIFHPTEGDLVLFPCFQMHFSHPFHTDGERILIASDIKVEDEFNFDGENRFISLNIGVGQ